MHEPYPLRIDETTSALLGGDSCRRGYAFQDQNQCALAKGISRRKLARCKLGRLMKLGSMLTKDDWDHGSWKESESGALEEEIDRKSDSKQQPWPLF